MIRRLIVLTSAMAVLTVVAGWWGVLLIAVVWGLVAERHTNPARTAALAGLAAWSVLLLWTASRGPVWMLSQTLAGILGLPGVVLIFVTVLFPALLALSSVALIGELKGRGKSPNPVH